MSRSDLDYKRIAEEWPENSDKQRERDCEKRIAEDLEQKKDEMLGKLKDLGNSILGNFGMSLDNFKMEKNAEGGYSVQFNNGSSN